MFNRVMSATVSVQNGFVVELLFVTEVIVDAGHIHVCGEANFSDGCGFKAFFGEDRTSSVDDAGSGALRSGGGRSGSDFEGN